MRGIEIVGKRTMATLPIFAIAANYMPNEARAIATCPLARNISTYKKDCVSQESQQLIMKKAEEKRARKALKRLKYASNK